jgi:uncharacterized membrane protein
MVRSLWFMEFIRFISEHFVFHFLLLTYYCPYFPFGVARSQKMICVPLTVDVAS